MISVLTAYSTHVRCFICGQNRVRLHRVKQESILYAYTHFGIIIKHHARCCNRHLDEFGQILEGEFVEIPVRAQPHPKHSVNLMNQISVTSLVFDRFKNMVLIDDEFCVKITGWTRIEFIRFARFIKSTYNTNGRTKDQLIAIYRYWLRKGIDQTSLAMFKTNTSQQEISHYLAQIRTAINKDFVPYFLGTRRQSRAFFLTHNTPTAIELYDLKAENKEKLVVIADGTYTRCEKSANNKFQYNTYSEQKVDSLLKPFLLCCADGYLIDCYGPFKANMNDAKILDYILKTDMDLMKILEAHKTIIVLDRGFKEIFNKLKEKPFFFDPKIPICRKLNDHEDLSSDDEKHIQDSTNQSNKNRFVGKIRFIIEKQIGNALKSKLALDNIRNSICGHIQIDYRIACAMYNFLHKPCISDNKRATKIAQKMKRKSLYNYHNPLKFFLAKHLDTKLIQKRHLSEIIDFVKLSKKDLIRNVFLGTFVIRQIKSYVAEVSSNGIAYFLSNKCIKQIANNKLRSKLLNKTSKIIGIEISSRHHRGINKDKISEQLEIDKLYVTYKVFIQYDPGVNSYKSIKAYICTCVSGRRRVGCCVHVATVIYYLSFGKYHQTKNPAEHLNSIFVDTENNEAPNVSKYVRGKRRTIFSDTDSNSSDSDSDPNDSDLNDSNLNSESNSELDSNPESDSESDLNEQEEVPLEYNNNPSANDDILSQIKQHVPKWGGIIGYQNKKIQLSNTCTIDYLLLALWLISKKEINIQRSLNPEEENTITEIIKCIDKNNWNKVKELWITKIMKLNVQNNRKTISLFGSENSKFIDYYNYHQEHELVQLCSSDCEENEKLINFLTKIIGFVKIRDKIVLYSHFKGNCSKCRKKISTKIQFIRDPSFLFIQSMNTIHLDEIPSEILVGNKRFRLLCTTLIKNAHFRAAFDIVNSFYLVDDLDQSVKLLTRPDPRKRYEEECIESNFYLKTSTSVFYEI